jgi:hypothetical protein
MVFWKWNIRQYQRYGYSWSGGERRVRMTFLICHGSWIWHCGTASRDTNHGTPKLSHRTCCRRAACKSLRYSRCATVRKLLLKKYRWKDLLGRQVIIPPLNCAGRAERSPHRAFAHFSTSFRLQHRSSRRVLLHRNLVLNNGRRRPNLT